MTGVGSEQLIERYHVFSGAERTQLVLQLDVGALTGDDPGVWDVTAGGGSAGPPYATGPPQRSMGSPTEEPHSSQEPS